MQESAAKHRSAEWANVPNLVTSARLVLTIVLFVLMGLKLYTASLVVFMIAAGTDWLDGFWARRYGQVTQLGRILDPFADKLIICGTYVYLAASPTLLDGSPASGVYAWMVVVIIARELIVTALRGVIEQRGGDFSAKWSGKWKMVFQCAAACFSLARLTYLDADSGALWPTPPEWIEWGLSSTLWIAVALTAYSGFSYIRAAVSMLRTEE